MKRKINTIQIDKVDIMDCSGIFYFYTKEKFIKAAQAYDEIDLYVLPEGDEFFFSGNSVFWYKNEESNHKNGK